MEQSSIVLETKQISKSYGSVVALDNVSLRFDENKIYGLFGRNGAGKTTLLDIISARIFADQGDVVCFGQDIAQHPEAISENYCYMPEKHYFPEQFKVKKLLAYARGTMPNYSVAYEEKLCQMFKLDLNQKYGMKSS